MKNTEEIWNEWKEAHLKQEEAHESTHQKQKWHKKSKIAASSNNPEEKWDVLSL